jgi:hypothetical protein
MSGREVHLGDEMRAWPKIPSLHNHAKASIFQHPADPLGPQLIRMGVGHEKSGSWATSGGLSGVERSAVSTPPVPNASSTTTATSGVIRFVPASILLR